MVDMEYYPKTKIEYDGKYLKLKSRVKMKRDGVWYEMEMKDLYEVRGGTSLEELDLGESMKRWEDRLLLYYVMIETENLVPSLDQLDVDTSMLDNRLSDPDDRLWKDPTLLGGIDKDLLKIMKDKWVY